MSVKTHIFLDEVVNALFLAGSPSDIKRCNIWDGIESALPEGCFCWISIGTHSYLMSTDFDPNPLGSYVPKGFKLYDLKFIMRVTGHVCDLFKGIEQNIGHGFFDRSSIGHTFMGPMPLLGTLADCECPTPTTPLCLCAQTRLFDKLKKVEKTFNFKKHDTTIVMFFFHCEEYGLPLYLSFQNILQSAFFELGIELDWKTMYGLQIPWVPGDPNNFPVINVVDQHTFIGCECRTVMCIDMFGMFQWFKGNRTSEWFPLIVNRCTSQYVHINWPEKEG